MSNGLKWAIVAVVAFAIWYNWPNLVTLVKCGFMCDPF
jgi:hypothetical protein